MAISGLPSSVAIASRRSPRVDGDRKEMTMADWFEDLSKIMADEQMGRRTAMRRVASTLAGGALASLLPELALARRKSCQVGGTCSTGFQNCPGNPNSNCYCLTDITGKVACICDQPCGLSCAGNPVCGKGAVCVVNVPCTDCGSATGVCMCKCVRKHKNCTYGGNSCG